MSFRFSKLADNVYLDFQKSLFLDVCFSSKFANYKCTHGTKSAKLMHLRTRLVSSEIVRDLFL